MEEQKLPSTDVVLEEVRRKLDFQFEQLDGLDTKSGIVLGIAGVIFTLLVTTLLEKHDAVVNSLLLIKVALAPILISLILSFVTVSTRKYDRPPNLGRLRNHYISEDAEKTKRSIIDISLAAIKKNEELIKKRVCLVEWSYNILAVGLGIMVVWVCSILWQ